LTKLSKLKRTTQSRSLALAMLCLVAHAAFVSVTHHHRLTKQVAGLEGKSVIANHQGSSQSTPDSGDDSNCLSCRLQRNFSSAIRNPSVAVLDLEQSLVREINLCAAYSKSSPLFLFGRAPPA